MPGGGLAVGGGGLGVAGIVIYLLFALLGGGGGSLGPLQALDGQEIGRGDPPSGELAQGHWLRIPLIEEPGAGDSVEHRLQAGDLVQPGLQFLRAIEHFANRSAHHLPLITLL